MNTINEIDKQRISILYGASKADKVFVDDKTEKHRAEMLKAMDTIVRNISDEEVAYLYWLQCGVPDGTHKRNDYKLYVDDHSYEEIVRAFKYCMKLVLKDM